MKNLIICILVLLALATSSIAATTNAQYVACTQKQYMNDMISFLAAKDDASFNSYIRSRKCIVMKGGLNVTVLEYPGMLGGITGFAYQGVKLWTISKGINYTD